MVAVSTIIPTTRVLPYWITGGETATAIGTLRWHGYEVIEVDVSGVENKADAILTIGRALGFPEPYGVNWDGFGDRLGDRLETASAPFVLLIRGGSSLAHQNLYLYTHLSYALISMTFERLDGHGWDLLFAQD